MEILVKISRRCWGNISAAMTKGMGASPTEKNITNRSSATTEEQRVIVAIEELLLL